MATYSDHAQRELDQQSGRELDRIAERRAIMTIEWIDGDGTECVSRFHTEYDAIRFEESLDAAGLPHKRRSIGARWPANKVPGRTPEEIAAATTAAIIAPNAEAMRLELAKRR